MAIDLDEIKGIYAHYTHEMEGLAPELQRYVAAYENRYWSSFGFEPLTPVVKAEDDPIPVKMETNMVWPFIAAHVANLFYRAPKTKATPPAVTSRPGRKRVRAPAMIEALLDDLINRASMRMKTTHGYTMSLMFGAAAFKVGVKDRGPDIVSRLWVDVLPRWEVLLDERARDPEQELYRGHIRWERIDKARQIVGDKLEGVEAVVLEDWLEVLAEGKSNDPPAPRADRPKRYVQLLEFYDLEDESQAFYIATGRGINADLKRVGKVLPAPYRMPTGAPAIPFEPVILSNTPHLPMRGIPATRRIYSMNSETNMLLSIVGSAMRRDSARLTAYLENHVGEEFVKAIKSGDPDRWVPFEGDKLDGLWKAIESPQFAQTLPQYKAWIEEARRDAQGFSDIMTGRQGKYLSATEAELLAGAGESTATEIASRMGEALGRTCELLLTILGAEAEGSISVTRGAETMSIDRDVLRMPWSITIQDAASTPVRDGQRKLDLIQVVDRFMNLVQLGSDPLPVPEAGVAPATVPSPAVVRAAARQLADYTVTLFQLPEGLKWSALELAAKAMESGQPKEGEGDDKPDEDGKPISDERAHELLEKLAPHLAARAQGGQVPPPPVGV